MRLLILTQKVDKNDPILGFFHSWLIKFAEKYESIIVICLHLGDYSLPHNVKVLSLGKEKKKNRFQYIIKFYQYIWQERDNYNAVFVHMNQEYVLLGGLIWNLLKKKVVFWRNHRIGNVLTDVAVFWSNIVCCTSKDSYTAKFSKTIIMPVGVDTDLFKPSSATERKKNSICMVGRLAPIKNLELGLAVCKELSDRGLDISATIIGSCLPKDKDYAESLRFFVAKNNMSSYIRFIDELKPIDMPVIYSSHEIYLNLTPAGSFDKTIVEASLCGAMPVVVNTSLRGYLPDICVPDENLASISDSINYFFNIDKDDKIKEDILIFAKSHSLDLLMEKIVKII